MTNLASTIGRENEKVLFDILGIYTGDDPADDNETSILLRGLLRTYKSGETYYVPCINDEGEARLDSNFLELVDNEDLYQFFLKGILKFWRSSTG